MAEEDILFGKFRHFFGGIEPSNMTGFHAVEENRIIKINAWLPTDTVIDGMTLCTVGGAWIRRKEGDYPEDEFDGTLVADIKQSTTITDTTATAGRTYYYMAFPYSAQGVYNRNPKNRTLVNEPPGNMTFTATSEYSESSENAIVKLYFTKPEGTAGVLIRRSTQEYPQKETDGEEVKRFTTPGYYNDTNVTAGVTYYYSAFPFTSSGAYNRSERNRATATPERRQYLFGYDLNENTSNPATRVTYPSNVDNRNYTPARMRFGSTFDYGGWNISPGEKFMPKPCMLNYSGTVAYYLNPNNLRQKENGQSSDVGNYSFGGNAMMEWPKIYVKRWSSGGVYHFRCSDVKFDSSWDCICNKDSNNKEIPHFYTPIFLDNDGQRDSTRLRSIDSNLPIIIHYGTSSNYKAIDVLNKARANGAGWCIETLADRLLIQDLLVMMSKTTDTQTAYGKGCENASPAVSSMHNKGMFWGSNSASEGVKVFGMENWWGYCGRFTAGLVTNYDPPAYKIKMSEYNGSYNVDGSGYSNIPIPNNQSYCTMLGYISSMHLSSGGRIPISDSGSSSTYETDYVYFSNPGGVAMCGYGNGNSGAGAFALSIDPTSRYYPFHAGLSCKPPARNS